jgi:hypothetical protein
MPRGTKTEEAEAVELPAGAIYQWGVRHPQGIRLAEDEKQARYDLIWLTESWKRGPSRHSPESKPMLMRRVLMPWEDMGTDYGPKVL